MDSGPARQLAGLQDKRAVISYTDLQGDPCKTALCGDYPELLQHEYDHPDGILAIMRAKDNKAFVPMRMMR